MPGAAAAVAPVEALDDPWHLVGRDAGPVVLDRDRGGAVRASDSTSDTRAAGL